MTNQQNIDAEPVSETKQRRNWNGRDVFFVVAPVICIILVPLWGFSYLCGRFFPYLIALYLELLLFPATIAFIFYCFLSGVIRLFRGWNRHTRKKKILLVTEISIPIVFIALIISILFEINLWLWWSGDDSFMYGFRERMRNKADIEDIRGWLKTLSKEDYTGDTNYLSYEELPGSLKVLGSKRNFLSADENGNPKISLSWGSWASGNWGVVIGTKDMKNPPSDFSRYGEYRLPVEPGVYVWHELQ